MLLVTIFVVSETSATSSRGAEGSIGEMKGEGWEQEDKSKKVVGWYPGLAKKILAISPQKSTCTIILLWNLYMIKV